MNIRNARWIALAMLLFAVLAGRAYAGDISKLGAWTIGHNLSLAAMLYGQDSPQQNIDTPLAKAKKAADSIKVDIKPFPPKGKNPARDDGRSDQLSDQGRRLVERRGDLQEIRP